jgi:hypothetical protein
MNRMHRGGVDTTSATLQARDVGFGVANGDAQFACVSCAHRRSTFSDLPNVAYIAYVANEPDTEPSPPMAFVLPHAGICEFYRVEPVAGWMLTDDLS